MLNMLRTMLQKSYNRINKRSGKYFISHSYKDVQVRDNIIKKLPSGMEPFIFPPINAKPDEFVNSHLIEAILSCDGLIYLRGGHSEKSFWVAFERDYALRIGMPVYAADPNTLKIELDKSQSLDLAIFSTYSSKDRTQINKITEYLSSQRYFDVWIDVEKLLPGQDWFSEIKNGLDQTVRRGGYTVVFWSKNLGNTGRYSYQGIKNNHVLVALLDNTPLPKDLANVEPIVQLYEDASLTSIHRLDNLVVNLYWLIYRNSKSIDL